jgi:hypothetical protein
MERYAKLIGDDVLVPWRVPKGSVWLRPKIPARYGEDTAR